jgi:hypothetical protein
MHVIPHNPQFDALQRGEKLFLEAWFNLTHSESRDSYRVRCHNGRTILEELKREMAFPFAKDADLAVVAAEAVQLCGKDAVLQKALGNSWPILKVQLTGLAKTKEEKKGAEEEGDEAPAQEGKRHKVRTQLDYVLTDVLPGLPPTYLKLLFDELEGALTRGEESAILSLADALASDLAARGCTVASLHSWVETTFLGSSWSSLPFLNRFQFFAERMKRPREAYAVIFSLSGSSELANLGQFCGVEFSHSPPSLTMEQINETPGLRKFLRVNPQRTFAKMTVDAVDWFSAIHEAEEMLAKCQDRLRFNFIGIPVERWRHGVLMTRIADTKIKLAPALASIPSPEHHLQLDEFLAASKEREELLDSGQIDETSQRRLEAAVRHYRLGLDARSYHDMLLNWWMGLETLTNTGGDGRGGIGGKVLANAVPLLVHNYFSVQLRCLSSVVKSACGKWPEEVTALLGGTLPKYLSASQLVRVLQAPDACKAVGDKLTEHPWVELRWKRFEELANSATKLATYLDDHETRVRWHIHRLYRLRCCLVHGTPVSTPLQLPTANLEYYLREAIEVVWSALGRAKQIHSLETVFDRAHYCASRRKELLHAKGYTAAEAISTALAEDLLFRS